MYIERKTRSAGIHRIKVDLIETSEGIVVYAKSLGFELFKKILLKSLFWLLVALGMIVLKLPAVLIAVFVVWASNVFPMFSFEKRIHFQNAKQRIRSYNIFNISIEDYKYKDLSKLEITNDNDNSRYHFIEKRTFSFTGKQALPIFIHSHGDDDKLIRKFAVTNQIEISISPTLKS